MKLTPEEREKYINNAGGIDCGCGNRICLKNIHEYWLSLIDTILEKKVEKVRDEVHDSLNVTGCVGTFQSSSPTEAKGWCCPRHYGQNNILRLPSLQISQVEVMEEYHNGKFRRTINGIEMPFKLE